MNSLLIYLKRLKSPLLVQISALLAFLLVADTAFPQAGPSVAQLSQSLNTAWKTLLKVTHCNLSSPQNALCIAAYNGKTITIRLFGEDVNALILQETHNNMSLEGTVTSQISGFLIGPINGRAYKIVNEKISFMKDHRKKIINAGLKVSAHEFSGKTINTQGIILNNKNKWLKGRNGPWIYHWSSLAIARESLKNISRHLNNQYRGQQQ